MKLVKGNKLVEIKIEKFKELIKKFEKVVLDLGTGDGRFVYKKALENSKTLFIGIDPSEHQLRIYSKKANRKKLGNALFVLGSFENMPKELAAIADKVFIILPWGSLLEKIVKPTKEVIKKLKNLFKSESFLEIVLGYSQQAEPAESTRLDLPKLTESYLRNEVIPVFEQNPALFRLDHLTSLKPKDVAALESSWGKTLQFSQKRPIYRIRFK